MAEDRIDPAACGTMAEVRQGVDALDEAIVTLLAERFRYMDAAARVKHDRSAVRDETRKAEVIANVVRLSKDKGIPLAIAAELYDRLIEASIAYELDRFDATRAP